MSPPRVNYRAVQDRFGHVDGTLVEARFAWPPAAGADEDVLAFRFYPWSEHPRYRALADARRPWAFTLPDDAYEVVRIYPRGLRAVSVDAPIDCTDVWFADEDLQLWVRRREGQLFVNETTSMAELGPHIDRALGKLAPLAREYLGDALDRPAPYALRMPPPLHEVIVAALATVGRATFVGHGPPTPAPMVMLRLGSDYLIAEDFEVEMPTFRFDDAWCHEPG